MVETPVLGTIRSCREKLVQLTADWNARRARIFFALSGIDGYWEEIERLLLDGTAMKRADKVIITCAITGGVHTPSMSPYLPITPAQIAAESVAAAAAGAAIIHLHARDPQTGQPDQTPERFLEGQQFISATNVIFHDHKRPSALILPIVPGK